MRPFMVKGEGCSPLVAYGAYLMDLGQLDRAIKMMGMGAAQAARALRYEIDAKVSKEIGTRVAHGASAGMYIDHSLPQFRE